MLQNLREHVQGWIATFVISLVILSFSLWGIYGYFSGKRVKEIAATVNGTDISEDTLNVAYDRLKRRIQLQSNVDDFRHLSEPFLRKQALKNLIETEVLNQAAHAAGYLVSAQQAGFVLTSLPLFQVNGHFSPERFQQVLTATLYTGQDLLALVSTDLLLNQPRAGLTFSAFVLPHEVDRVISLIDQKRQFDYFILPNSYFLKKGIAVPDAAVQAYYDSHQEQYKVPEKISIQYVLLSTDALEKRVKVTEADLQHFYQENISTFTQPAVRKIQKILISVPKNTDKAGDALAHEKINNIQAQLKKGKSFSKLAKQYSDEKTNQLLWLMVSQVSPELKNSFLTLEKQNQIVGPIQTKEGFVFLQLLEYKPAQISSFEKMKSSLKKMYVQQKAMQLFANLSDQFANISYAKPNSLQPVADALGLNIQETGLFTQDQPGRDAITKDETIRKIAFGEEVLTAGNNSTVISLSNTKSLVLRLKNRIKATNIPYEQVKESIKKILQTELARQEAVKAMTEVKNKLETGTSLTQLAASFNQRVQSIPMTDRHDEKIKFAILQTAFSMPTPQGSAKTVALSSIPEGEAVIVLDAVQNGNPKKLKEAQYIVFAKQLGENLGIADYQLYRYSLIRQSHIKTHEHK